MRKFAVSRVSRMLATPCLLSVILSVPLIAQGAGSGWLPRSIRLSDLTPTQRAAAVATLDKVERLLRQVPELAQPDGFQIQPLITGGARQMGPNQKPMAGSVVEYILTLVFRVRSPEGCNCISVRINAPRDGRMSDAQGHTIYIEESRAMEPHGTPREIAGTLWQVPSSTQVYGELWDFSRDIREGRGERSGVTVLFVGAGELPFVPVSREAFYQAIRIEREGADGASMREVRASLSKTRYQEWMEQAPERQKSRDATMAAARNQMSADEVAKLRKTLDDTDRQVTEQLQKSEAEDRRRNDDALARLDRYGDDLTRELEAMSPEERRMPVYINNALQEGPIATGWRLTKDPAPPAWRALSPDYDFWRARKSPTEVRSINVHIGISGTGLHPKVRKALLQTFRTLNWSAFNDLLDTRR